MKYQGIIFDFNGVLLLDTQWHDEAWRLTSEEVRGNPLTPEEMNTHVHGRTNKDIFEYLLGRKTTDEELLNLIQNKENIYRNICLSKREDFKLSPGAEKLLDLLAANDIPHTIATSSEITNLNFFIEHLRLARWFKKDSIIYDDGTMPGKPEPHFYLLAAEKLILNPRLCVVIEDSESGIESARRAGIGKIIAFGPEEKFNGLKGVDKIISRLDEITLVDFE